MNRAPSTVAAIVLAGGRSSRLDGRPKSALRFDGQTLLERTLDAVVDARRVVIVGDPALVASAAPNVRVGDGSRVIVTREHPPFAGPAAAIAAGVDALLAFGLGDPVGRVEGGGGDALVVVLACDMPNVSVAVRALLSAASPRGDRPATGSGVSSVSGVAPGSGVSSVSGVVTADGVAAVEKVVTADGVAADGVMAVDSDGRAQFLTAVYRLDALAEAVARTRSEGSLENLSVRRLFAPLRVSQVVVPPGSTRDVDTVVDAHDFGIDLSSPDGASPADLSPDGRSPGDHSPDGPALAHPFTSATGSLL